ncbi:biotin-dependent carboxyltransferase family protein [Actinoplanes sp. NEAU-A12]|uniref:Biotin-dependent carboxyltransferase family protein n=1 Tax=Actinoplanes sandaracinus TaxID=3045177 RepID=A0ABT6WGS4_9ACTN|nr:biotin-dependent carboxyltransferase family protein [Actinoplanes sandaracinus]MDI6098900.1 biotin-dependent carboxyltransferase family protein [Actinoplanes sandaracinus]
MSRLSHEDPVLEVVRAGVRTTVQDLGRPGFAHLGVPRSGAADAGALRLANRLAGNPPGAAGLEILLGGVRLRATRAVTLAVTGAPCAVTVGDRPADPGFPLAVPAGAHVTIGRATAGLRVYLAAGGGIAVPPVLGSRSTDTLSGLGPRPVRDGDLLPVGPVTGPPPAVDVAPYPPPAGELRLRVWLGPRDDWFTASARDTLFSSEYRVSAETDRIGARLTGPALARAVDGELPSEGLVLGAIQVPANGQPLIFLADHPTTGGYPVIGVVDPADIGLVGQARPGTPVRFTPAPHR